MGKNTWKLVCCVAAVAVAVLALPMCSIARSFVFAGAQPGGCSPDTEYGCTAEYTTFAMQDGTELRGWLFNRGRTAPLVVVFGGNSMNAGAMNYVAEADATRSYLLVNYRGFGGSAGTPTEKDVVQDSCALVDMARQRLGSPAATTLVGFSLGTGVAMQVAAAKSPDKVVLICPFDSLVNVACDFVPGVPRALIADTFDSARYAPQVACPVTIFRADCDEVVHAPRTQKLKESFGKEVPERVFSATHNSIFSAEGFLPALLEELR